ncbi:MAG: glycoside hydrolase family 15 protein [Caulobacterales bacterium]
MVAKRRARLRFWLDHIERIFVARQTAMAGLLPASTAQTVHGDYRHAWVRDNVYSLMAPFALARALKRDEEFGAAGVHLDGFCRQVMRGLLHAMMRQADKVEAFKYSEDPLDSLHAKYDAETGNVVVADDGWGHLQLDATGLFLLQLAQMTAAGVGIVDTRREADFVQNLVHYIGPAYRIPDYGVWERGHKGNHGVREINASSVGMAKAALEAMSDLVLPLTDDAAAIIRVAPDEIVRARETLAALLPAESASKETDAALFSILGFPAYAVEDAGLAFRTKALAIEKLMGRFGCKRFLRDGHQTVLEDKDRLHYHAGELAQFAHIECEWPLFFAFLGIDAALARDAEMLETLTDKLDALAVEIDGDRLAPELYIVPANAIAAERAAPGTQRRIANGNVPLYWTQSLWVIAALLRDNLILPDDLDPLGRRNRRGAPVGGDVDVAIIADTAATADIFAACGAPMTLADIFARDATILPQGDLARLLSQLGENAALGLSGRPERRLGALITSFVYEQSGRAFVFTPSSLDVERSYLRYDGAAFADRLRADIAYIARHWTAPQRPLLVVPVRADLADGAGGIQMRQLLADLARGQVGGARVKALAGEAILDRAQRVIDDLAPLPTHAAPPAAAVPVNPLWRTQGNDLDAAEMVSHLAQDKLLALLGETDDRAVMIEGLARAMALGLARADTGGRGSVRRMALGLYDAVGRREDWQATRRMAAIIGLVDERLADSMKELVVRFRTIRLGASSDAVIAKPMPGAAIRTKVQAALPAPVTAILAEEVILHLGAAMKADPQLFQGVRCIRAEEWLDILNDASAFAPTPEPLHALSPQTIADRIRAVLVETPSVRRVLTSRSAANLALPEGPQAWRIWRARLGVLTRVGPDFFDRMWRLLGQCDAIALGAGEGPARLDAALLRADHTPGERQFAARVEAGLETIADPLYRALTLEALNAAAWLSEDGPHLRVRGDIALDRIIHAVVNGEDDAAWVRLVNTPAAEVAYQMRAAAAHIYAEHG